MIPKTLRLWLKAAHLSSCQHPADARLKCLTLPQLQQVAQLHGRCLPSLPGTTPEPVAPPSASSCGESTSSASPLQNAELRQQLSLLQQQVATLQAQVTELALVLVQAQLNSNRYPMAPLQAPTAACALPPPAKVLPPPEPERTRTRSRALPLIQVRADSSVVVISPTEGVLPLVPDSPQWFVWLSSLTAFTFENQQGHFSATRKFRGGQRIQSWNVHRSLHGRSCTLYLGLTPTLTLARLQDMVATVHARLTAL